MTFVSTDDWFIALAGIGVSVQTWTEPFMGDFGNLVGVSGVPNLLSVSSDFPIDPNSGLADGTPDTTTFTLNGNPLSVTFFDKGDVATAPDTGSTLGLLSLSVVALLGATRLRFLQLAA